jgi:hypothetical protein
MAFVTFTVRRGLSAADKSPAGDRQQPPPPLRTKQSNCSASAYTSRLGTSYSSSTRWNRTSRACLLRRSGEIRPRIPKPSKRDPLVEATKGLLWEER